MRRVFVSGCFDLLHSGHIQFFEDARAFGQYLIVSVATDAVLMRYKGRNASMPIENKLKLIASVRYVDRVIPSSNVDAILDFRDSILVEQAHVLVVTEDDRHVEEKRSFCDRFGIELAIVPKRCSGNPISTTELLSRIKDQRQVPLRVDFAGGWLDVPRLSRSGGYIVNCTIEPQVSLENWPYEIGSGVGGSAARAILEMKNGFHSELQTGVGWQDPAVIQETGLCVWRSGASPVLDYKVNPEWLRGLMLLFWTGKPHNTLSLVDKTRDYDSIWNAGQVARIAVKRQDVGLLATAMEKTYKAQLDEGMGCLPGLGSLAMKYLGSGHGGYALYLFSNRAERAEACSNLTKLIEPYMRHGSPPSESTGRSRNNHF